MLLTGKDFPFILNKLIYLLTNYFYTTVKFFFPTHFALFSSLNLCVNAVSVVGVRTT